MDGGEGRRFFFPVGGRPVRRLRDGTDRISSGSQREGLRNALLRRISDWPHALQRHRRHVPTAAPLVLNDVLDVCPPAAAAVAHAPSPLQARPPLAAVLDLHGSRWVEAALLDESNG